MAALNGRMGVLCSKSVIVGRTLVDFATLIPRVADAVALLSLRHLGIGGTQQTR